MKIRSFLAFDISHDIQRRLAAILEMMAKKAMGIVWCRPHQLHCTVKFFGSVEEELLLGSMLRIMEQKVRDLPPLHFRVTGVGVFPNWRYPRVLWAGLNGDLEIVERLHQSLEEAFLPLGIALDQRKFRVHLTLGRSKSSFRDPQPLMTFVEKQVNHDFGEMMVSCLTLYKSVLTKDGPQYTILKQFPLEANREGSSS